MKKLLIVFGLLLSSCRSSQEYSEHYGQIMSEYLQYYKDDRTNTCYASAVFGTRNGVLTYVPCNKEIEESAMHFSSKKPSWK